MEKHPCARGWDGWQSPALLAVDRRHAQFVLEVHCVSHTSSTSLNAMLRAPGMGRMYHQLPPNDHRHAL